MLITKKSKSLRARIKKWALFHREQGKIAAAVEFNNKIKIISAEYQKALAQRDKTYTEQMLLSIKQENKFLELCKAVEADKKEVSEVLEQMKSDQSQIRTYSRAVRASWHSEKVKKRVALDHDENETNLFVTNAEKRARAIL